MQSDVCIHTHILHHLEMLVGKKKYKNGDNSECGVPGKSCRVPEFRRPWPSVLLQEHTPIGSKVVAGGLILHRGGAK